MNVASLISSSVTPACFAPAKRVLLQGSQPAISAHAYDSSAFVLRSRVPGEKRKPANS